MIVVLYSAHLAKVCSSRCRAPLCAHPAQRPLVRAMRASARTLHRKALSSIRTAMTAFNTPSQRRPTYRRAPAPSARARVLRGRTLPAWSQGLRHDTGRSIGFDAAINQSCQLAGFQLTNDEAGTLRSIDALRDGQQHWFDNVRGLLYLHCRSRRSRLR